MIMMSLGFSVSYMTITGFLIQYFIMSNIMSNDFSNITNNLSKVYLSAIMAFIMGILEVIMFDVHNKTLSLQYYVPLFLFLSLSLFLYRKQIFVDETNYLREMIEHHDMAVFTSKNILDKPNISYTVRQFPEKIINKQTNEISEMKEIVDGNTVV